jgi:hypothetical protein
MPHQTLNSSKIREFKIPDRWCLHSYYSLCPYAPDGSGRILISGTNLETNLAEVLVLSLDGSILDRFGSIPATPSYWHTGLWQSWSEDSMSVYFQSGSLKDPYATRHNLKTGEEITVAGDVEGMPPLGEPALSCSHGLLYAAGYGGNPYNPEVAPIPFQARTEHGISEIYFDDPTRNALILSTQDILNQHPQRERILAADQALKKRMGSDAEGLTLMTYCVRWSRDGQRCLFFFGNHCVDRQRGEPKITSIFTASRDLKEIHLAIDLSFERRGVHWSWQADNELLIGYGPDPESEDGKLCLAEVKYDGTGYRKLSDHASAGHPSTSPADTNLIVTDENSKTGGNVVFISKLDGQVVERVALPKFIGDFEPGGRNPLRVCHHPVFNHNGDRVLCNSLPGKNATLVELIPPTLTL